MTTISESSRRGPRAASPTAGQSLYGAAAEYGLHCLTWLVGRETPASSRDLAELQGAPASMVAKILSKLEKAGIVASTGGIGGGYLLARPPEAITVLDVVDAIDGRRSVFNCKDVRENCVLFSGGVPAWANRSVCGIHAVMLRAEKSMRAEMARTSLLAIVQGVPAPSEFVPEVSGWLDARVATREQTRITAVRAGARRRSTDG
ncbi:RrF2 family transcriptional regulator [Caulobacter soli]|uniref:RrF2 family transcriptional regulator n=1 Tax=Caulobacter soli TaxID=2708539 RepID=UPI0013ED0593|nr:Rrf2 family transcriptional regulator [Caulobacter soli]